MIGRIIGNYQVTSELAHGGMGVVYRGQHLHLPREVVVKSILLAPFSPSAQIHLKARFRREAYIQSQLDHSNIVRVYEFFTAEDNYFLVMEYVPGMSLRDLLARQGVPAPAQAVYLFKQALQALDYAHSFSYVDESELRHTGVIHRDIKPANLLLDTKGRLKISDFGIARVLGEQAGGAITQAGVHPGTIEYMAPEQIRGIEVDRRSDIYSLGVTFYEMLCGRLPFERPANGSDWELRKGHIEEEPPPILDRCPDLPPALAAIVMRTLRKNPNDRFQSAAEMLEALRNYEPRQSEARAGNGKAAPLIVAATPASEPARPARPSQALIENATSMALEAVNREADAIAQSATKVIHLAQAASRSSAGLFQSVIESPPARGHWRIAAALALACAVAGAYWVALRPGKPDPAAVASKTEAATPNLLAKAGAKSKPGGDEATALTQARTFEQAEQYVEAIQAFEAYLARHPSAPDAAAVTQLLNQLKLVQAHLVSAETAMGAGQYRLAARQFGEALRLQPASQRARDGLTLALAKAPDMLRPAVLRPRSPGETPTENPEAQPADPNAPPPIRSGLFGPPRETAAPPELPESEAKPDAKLEPKSDVKSDPKPDVKTEGKSDPKPEAKSEPKPDVKSEGKSDPKPEAKPQSNS
jgi:serine/threonine protein kinase